MHLITRQFSHPWIETGIAIPWSRPNRAKNMRNVCVIQLHSHIEIVFCLLVNIPIYNLLYQSLCFDSVSLSLRNRAFSSNPRAQALSARCFLLNGRRQDSKRSLGYVREIDSKSILSTLGKDTANPLSHQVMASSNFFNWTQALAPVNKQSTV